ncbi:Helicase PriA essential for oriC/DnaA-independent DNA replication [hydrothermal vent metagenome]|uniref:DNA 3'-5' helicase n=1 Tax=hydrothermal vent metagenome TaxID=652676 RepID=A0A3B0RBM8_9ZZZZ
MMNRLLLAKILFPLPVPEPFDYLVPASLQVTAGSYVIAPLGTRKAVGVVWAITELPEPPKGRKLKQVLEVFATRPMSQQQRDFIDFVGKYTCAGSGRVLRMCLPNLDALLASPTRSLITRSAQIPTKLTPARNKVLEIVADKSWPIGKLAEAAGVGSGVVNGLLKAGGLQKTMQAVDGPFAQPQPERSGLKLTASQIAASNTLIQTVQQQKFTPVLLDGITGSGKTEVYFEAVAEALRQHPDHQVLILLPEIALTQDVLQRFAVRFGAKPAEWHSDVTGAMRRRVWRQVANGTARIVVGARSALFLPFAKLALIVVDEEHDSSYKQEEGVLYHARDMAVVRANLADCPILLASATPALETLHNARSGRFAHLMLDSRPGSSQLPHISAIDLRINPPATAKWLSPPLREAMQLTLGRGEQVLLYLNRRGYAPLTICRNCGERMKSPDTDSFLVEHKHSGRLICHLTGFSMPKPDKCPTCAEPDSLHPVGPGVERLAEEVAAVFPKARCEVFSSDTTRTPAQIRELIARMQGAEIDILIGTQMAAKGHNFPKLTLVGVVDADMGLGGADLRAGERTYQALIQVAGRAGRAELPGRAMLQTHQPEHEAIEALLACDRERFIEAELSLRQHMGFPPFGRLAAVVISAFAEAEAEAAARDFAAVAPNAPSASGIEIWGPSEPVFTVVRGRFRRRLLIRAEKHTDLSAYMHDWRAGFQIKGSVRLKIDIDPYSFL